MTAREFLSSSHQGLSHQKSSCFSFPLSCASSQVPIVQASALLRHQISEQNNCTHMSCHVRLSHAPQRVGHPDFPECVPPAEGWACIALHVPMSSAGLELLQGLGRGRATILPRRAAWSNGSGVRSQDVAMISNDE